MTMAANSMGTYTLQYDGDSRVTQVTEPFGLTLNVEPHWGFFDEASGIKVDHFGVELAMAILKAGDLSRKPMVANLPKRTVLAGIGDNVGGPDLGENSLQEHSALFIETETEL